ncbi:MAG: hypothetical protein HY401_03460 [Elusimicrobia bacterium]|nr:hypothetical protein [Elusimicrobiota bacterium]
MILQKTGFTIIAHRGNLSGPSPSHENSLSALDRALAQGFSIETDIRKSGSGKFYISHDRAAWTGASDAAAYCRSWRRYPDRPVFLNIKELGYEVELLRFLEDQGVIGQVRLFDMELLEKRKGKTLKLFRKLHASVGLLTRVSDRGEEINEGLGRAEAGGVWLDEFDRPWAGRREIRQIQRSGKKIYAVSPELHGFGLEAARRRWRDFLEWGADGICTDYPLELAQIAHGRIASVPTAAR